MSGFNMDETHKVEPIWDESVPTTEQSSRTPDIYASQPSPRQLSSPGAGTRQREYWSPSRSRSSSRDAQSRVRRHDQQSRPQPQRKDRSDVDTFFDIVAPSHDKAGSFGLFKQRLNVNADGVDDPFDEIFGTKQSDMEASLVKTKPDPIKSSSTAERPWITCFR